MSKKIHGRKRQRAARKQPPKRRHKGPGRPVPSSVMKFLEEKWPFYEVLVNEDWREFGHLTELIVSRRSLETGDLVTGVFLVDLGCLGIKNGFFSFLDLRDYLRLVDKMSEQLEMVKCEPDLAAKILLAGLEYADTLGFKPNPNAVEAFPVLLGANASACAEAIPLGNHRGKPFFVSGPRDNVKRIRAILDRTVGPGEYEFILGGPGLDFLE